ncbi:unnamed protein product [Sphagnum troendelagicum]|uniref:Uncharacterized protein n=1 Tax=Sphagnum troendelagicum TaxID=128251 RepID=A0ABP0TGU8_9BRYO
MLLYSEIFLFSGEWLTDDGCLSPIWPLVNEVSLCVTCRCATSLRQIFLCAQSFASRPVPYREACGGSGN